MRFFDRYTGFFRRVKAFYVLYNFLHRKKLAYLKPLFKKYGIKRAVYMPLHSEHFKKLPQALEARSSGPWSEDGFEVLEGVLDSSQVDSINAQVDQALKDGRLGFNYTGRKILFAYEELDVVRELMHHPRIVSALEERAGAEILPFQSINFYYGSEQKAHSDSIHMSTYPQGSLVAAWIALDDIEEDNGPLFYYPGSHRWPYATNADIGASTGALLSPNPNKLYEQYVEQQLVEKGMKPQIFKAKKGDVLLWHANLLHGGMPHLNMGKTRRSVVIHYFVKDVICYHEISQRPAFRAAL